MHTTITLLVQEESLEEAIREADWFLENEHSFFDGYTVCPDTSCPLSEMSQDKKAQLQEADFRVAAEDLLQKAEKLKSEESLSLCGSYYRHAGELYLENLSEYMPYYNITDFSYRFPEDEEGWFAVEVDFHF